MKKIFKYLKFFIMFAIFLCVYNNVEAKDIEFHATVDGNDIVFQTFIGSETGTTNDWADHYNSVFEKSFNKKQFRFLSKNYLDYPSTYSSNSEKDIFGSQYSDLYNISNKTVGSYSYIIHNKPFTIYATNGTTYRYSTSLTSKGKNIGISGFNKEEDVSSIEFKKLTNGYQLIKPTTDLTSSINVSNNKFTKEYIDILKKNINTYKAGEGNDSYWFWISEPLAWRFNSGLAEGYNRYKDR